ncbi:hypothetical protein [Streptomyces sp. NPDC050164]|uniref:hypothetical protein n=1 Tax=Streptomyces sp. NPDC050164 TaxID=3365605 RepID=UPI0037971311
MTFKVEGKTPSKGSGPITSTAVDWEPPACWYEPYWKAKNFKTYTEANWSMYESVGGDPEGIADDKARYTGGHPYKDFNVDKNDQGMWWVAVTNPKMKDDPAAGDCKRKPFWVDNGENPDVPRPSTPRPSPVSLTSGPSYPRPRSPWPRTASRR